MNVDAIFKIFYFLNNTLIVLIPEVNKNLYNFTMSKTIDIKQLLQHSEVISQTDQFRPAAYARVIAKLPKYASRAVKTIKAARPIANAREVGESVRHIYPSFVRPLFLLSFGYVLIDIGIKSYEVRHKNIEYRKWFLIDQCLWHLGASMILPGVAVHQYIHGISRLLAKAKFGHQAIKVVSSVSALCLIPFIIHPIDHVTDHVLNKTFRQYVNFKNYDEVGLI
jgi:hypothetical protein